MLKNKMWHTDFWEKKKKNTDTLCLPYKRIDKFLFSMLRSTQMCMECQKMSRGHGKCDNGTKKKPKENKAYEKLCQQLTVLLR